MHDIIPHMFDYWADPVIHILLLKRSLLKIIVKIFRKIQLYW